MTELQRELDVLNRTVDEAIAKRTAWMDGHMAAFARYAVGEEIFDRATGRRLGVVSRLYRYHGPARDQAEPRDSRFDRSMSVEYEFETAPLCFDNTSRRGGPYSICNRKELTEMLEAKAVRLREGVA